MNYVSRKPFRMILAWNQLGACRSVVITGLRVEAHQWQHVDLLVNGKVVSVETIAAALGCGVDDISYRCTRSPRSINLTASDEQVLRIAQAIVDPPEGTLLGCVVAPEGTGV